MLTPIAVMSFRRPDKLRDVLISLKAQVDCRIDERQVHLFQDNAVNAYSGLRYAEDAEVAQCVETFSSIFPKGTIHLAQANIGICENFDRAENFLFDELGAACAYFFEDDLVLSPAYVQMLDLMQAEASKTGLIAYFAAYGDYYSPPAPDEERARRLMPLDHHWGFGLFAQHRARIRAEIQPFLDLVVGHDYIRRNHIAVYEMYRQLGSCPRGSSQDAAKAHACARLGYWRCNTTLPFARYVGDVGAHMDKELFDKLGFAGVTPSEHLVGNLLWPSRPELRGFVEQQKRLFRSIAETELDSLIAKVSYFVDPMRHCTHEDVQSTYRVLLHREPEAEVFARHVGNTPVFTFVESVLNSDECCLSKGNVFRFDEGVHIEGAALDPNRPCTQEDIGKIYELLIHRGAEAAAVERNVVKHTVIEVVVGALASPERRLLLAALPTNGPG